MKIHATVRIAVHLCAALAMASCGPRPEVQEPEEEVVEEEPEPEPADDGMQIEGITGTLSQTDVNDTMNMKAIPAYNLCFQHYLEKHDFVYGSINMKFIVASSGKTSEVQLLDTDYGHRDLENCIVAKSKFIKFPKPKGGATEVTYSFDTDVLEGVPEPVTLHAGKVKKALEPYQDEIEECLGSGSWVITLYVGDSMTEEVEDEDGNIQPVTISKILILGGYSPEGADLDAVECLADEAESFKLEMDVDGVGKVTLDL